jgi:uncharacterized PurR-regulated membrane protein YhhQ (DUF165 family)
MKFYKNIKPIYLYFVSIIAFVVSNTVREKNIPLYYVLLFIGAIFFIIGFFKGRSER